MQTLNISLPETLKQFVDSQVTEGGYGTVSDYLRALILADEKRKAGSQLETLLLEGLDSAESALTATDWKAIRAEALERLRGRSKEP